MQKIDFENTQVAFKYRSDTELRKARFLFSLLNYPFLMSFGSSMILFLKKMKIAPVWILKPLLFRHFCGGVNIQEAEEVAHRLSKFNVKSIPDYSVEGRFNESGIERVVEEILNTIKRSSKNPYFPFAVFKPSALAPQYVLEKMNRQAALNDEENEIATKFNRRFELICKCAFDHNVRILVDAEEYSFQDVIDRKTEEMMRLYNKSNAIVFNTFQMYRHDREDYLKRFIAKSKEENFFLGVKIVRGAYLEKENFKAIQGGYPTPIHPSKKATDDAYNRAIAVVISNLTTCELFVGTHNLESIELLLSWMENNNLSNNDSRIYISQLYGMSDTISFNLSMNDYNVVKYLPYGPVKEAIPYLIRRANENSSVSGQTGRELGFIQSEIYRRKSKKTS